LALPPLLHALLIVLFLFSLLSNLEKGKENRKKIRNKDMKPQVKKGG
jgi:hypothetical protein